MVTIFKIIPDKHQHVSNLMLAFSLKHHCAYVQPHGAACMAVDSNCSLVYTLL